MDEQQMIAALGGLKDDGATVDPVSGNEVPPGSMDQEVSDQVDAKLSEGEYVLPADVVRYLGVDKIEKLVKKAKEGLAEMEANGRIGGEESEEPEEELPFSDDELEVEDDAMVMEMAVGGLVENPYESQYMKNQKRNPLFPSEGDTNMGQTPGMFQTGFGRSMDQWSADDYDSFAGGRESFDHITKYASALGGLPGLIAGAAVRGVTKNMEKKARERLEQTLQSPDLAPEDRQRYQSAYDKLSQRHEEDDSITSGKPRDSMAATIGLYGKDKIPFNEGMWSWTQEKKKREEEKEKNKEDAAKSQATKDRESSSSSAANNRGNSDNKSSSLAPTTSNRPSKNPSRMAKGGLVKRRK